MVSATRVRRLMVGILFVVAFQPTTMAAYPSVLIVGGGGLKQPIVITLEHREEVLDLTFLFGRASDGTSSAQLDGRPYLNVSMFWGNRSAALADPALLRGLRPSDANQHGRLYLPTATEPAAMLATMIRGSAYGEATVPDFASGWALTDSDRDTARRLGLPGF